jgi:type I restriction enzyme S subunit
MKKHTAAQKRLSQNATTIVATRLLFNALSENYSPQILSGVITIFNGQSLKKSERQDDGLFDVYGSGGLVGNYSEFLSERPFVVIGRKGSAGKPTYAPFGGWVIDTAYYAQPNDENTLDTKYLYFGLSSIDFSDDIIVTAIPGVNRTAIYKHRLPIPPLEVQLAINVFLEAVANKTTLPELPDFLNHLPAVIARVESLVVRVNEAQRLCEDAEFEAELLVGREIASLFANAKDWNSYNLGDLISEMSYGTSEKAHNERVGIPVLRMGNIQSGKLDLTGLKYMHPSEQEMKKLRLQKGDILVNRTNSAELVGKCAVFDLEGDYLFASYIIRIRLDQQKADPRLVAQYINSPAGRAYMFAERKQMTGQANVNSKKLAALPISLPSLDEQRRIVAYLDGLQAKVNALRELQSTSGEELSALMPSVLDRAFKGEL